MLKLFNLDEKNSKRKRYTNYLLKISIKAIKKGGSRESKCALFRIRPQEGNLKIKSARSGAQTS